MNDFHKDESKNEILKVQDLAFKYTDQIVFSGWEFKFNSGVTWLKGRNGSGKSTLLKLLAGALKPSIGDIEIMGIKLKIAPLQYQKQVFYCGPGPIVFDHLTPSEFFGFMRNLYPNCHENNLTQNISGFDLTNSLHSPLKTLSTGTQRKVWLAFALAAASKVTLLDEPFNALDSKSLVYFRTSLGNLSKDTSRLWIVASHEYLGDGILVTQTLEMTR